MDLEKDAGANEGDLAKGITWTTERRKLRDLQPWPRNPRQIKTDQAKRLVESFDQFGQVETIAIGPDNGIYNGHQRLNVLMQKYGGDYEVECRVSSRSLTEKEREKLTVFLHKGTAGEWDFDTLANEFELEELLEWGFDPKDLDLSLWQSDPPEDPGAQIDKAEELREKWGVETGQLWQLGDHRLICGDCTDKEVINAVAFGNPIDLWVSDPPYGVSYADKNAYLNAVAKGNRVQVPIVNDHLTVEEAAELWKKAFSIIYEIAKPGCVYYVNAPQGGDLMMMMMVLRDSGWLLKPQIIWVKNNHVLGRSDYQLKHEPILYGWKEGSHYWCGSRNEMSTWMVDKPLNSDYHPTMKPVELIEKAIANSSKEGEVVIDGFLGSGTTLIACERLGRKCRAVEISPAYCAVAIERWHQMTGKMPELING